MIGHKIIKIKGTENSFLLVTEGNAQVKVLINNANDISIVIKEVVKQIKDAYLGTHLFEFLRPDKNNTIHYEMVFSTGETFGVLTEDKFLEDLDVYSNIEHRDFVNAIRSSIKEFDAMCEKYKLLIE